MGCVDWNAKTVKGEYKKISRTPHGVRGLKYKGCRKSVSGHRRTPHGVRGLKFINKMERFPWKSVAPRMGCVDWNFAVIFICICCNSRTPHGVRGLKCDKVPNITVHKQSHPAWGAWIEIYLCFIYVLSDFVAPRMGCVDWNGLLMQIEHLTTGRTPHGVRGLKCCLFLCKPCG